MLSVWFITSLDLRNIIFSCFQLIACYSTKVKTDKIFESAAAAVADIPNGSKLLFGGFGVCGIPEKLIDALRDTGVKDITAVSNNGGLYRFTNNCML